MVFLAADKPHGAPLSIVVAMTKDRVIGKDGKLPWHVPEDLRHFRKVTTGHAIIMGRKTYESIGKPLPNRRNMVVGTRIKPSEGVEIFSSLEEAIAKAREHDTEPCVIGGSSIFARALPLCTRIYLTEIMLDVEGDTFFPELDRAAFREVERRAGEDPAAIFVTLERV